jgi:hypothetical protein
MSISSSLLSLRTTITNPTLTTLTDPDTRISIPGVSLPPVPSCMSPRSLRRSHTTSISNLQAIAAEGIRLFTTGHVHPATAESHPARAVEQQQQEGGLAMTRTWPSFPSPMEFAPQRTSSYSPGNRGSLGKVGATLASSHACVTLMFADIVGFTSMADKVDPSVVMTFLHSLYSRFDALLTKHNVYKVGWQGAAS